MLNSCMVSMLGCAYWFGPNPAAYLESTLVLYYGRDKLGLAQADNVVVTEFLSTTWIMNY